LPTKAITNDDKDHVLFCLRVLSDRSPSVIKIFAELCRQALNDMLVAKELEEALNQKAKEKQGNVIQADDPISFLQLQADKSGELGENVFETSLSQALVGGPHRWRRD
jgi:coatomer subunit beta